MHLSTDELIDLAEGTRAEAAVPHLAACAACRGQLEDLRAAMTAAAETPVPEPSPLFWDQLSRRVHDEVAASPVPQAWWQSLLRPAVLAPAIVAVVAIVAAGTLLNAPRPSAPPTLTSAAPPSSIATGADARADVSASADDPSLMLVADLASQMDQDEAREAGLATLRSAEHAVTQMDAGELRELQKLLQEAMQAGGKRVS